MSTARSHPARRTAFVLAAKHRALYQPRPSTASLPVSHTSSREMGALRDGG